MGIDMDLARELQDARIIDEMYAEAPEPEPLSEFISEMRLTDFESDAGEMLLCHLEAPLSEIQVMLSDAQDEAENWDGDHSALFKERSAQIVHAMLESVRNYREICA